MSATAPFPMTEIQRGISVLFQSGQLLNVRGLTEGGMSSHLYDDLEQAAGVIEKANRNEAYKALFYTIQRIKPDTVLEPFKGVREDHIASYEWFVIDIDTVRPDKSRSNSTDAEKQASFAVTERIQSWLLEKGFPDPVVADSGNGWHLYYRLESLPNTAETYQLLQECLRAIAHKFRDDAAVAEVDVSMADPAQLTKAFGSLVRKGPHTKERPWRQSKLLHVPSQIEALRRIRLVLLSAEAPALENKAQTKKMPQLHPDFDIYDFLEHYGIGIESEQEQNGCRLFVTDECYTCNPPHKHTGSKATGFVLGDTLGWHCFSDDCVDKGIGDVLRSLNADHEPYKKPIWVEKPRADVKEIPPCEDEVLTTEQFGVALGVVAKEHKRLPLEMPENCMYGRLGNLARKLEVPLGFAYPAMLAVGAACDCRDPKDNVRGTLYVGLIGAIGTGKSVAMRRAVQSLRTVESAQVRTTPGSDRGLIKLLKNKGGKAVLLIQDEFRNTMAKCSIQGSSLAPVLCNLWSENIAGAADKKGVDECDVRLSILGNLACEDGEEFAEIFGLQTSRGLADRFVLGVAPPLKYKPAEIRENFIEPKPCAVPGWVFDRKYEWENSSPERRRLGEIGLRIALITSAMNGDQEITPDAMNASLRFCEWQEQIRAQYQPGLSQDLDGKCTEAILVTLMTLPKGKSFNWSTLAKRKNWYKKYGVSRLTRVRSGLVKAGEIGFDEESGAVWV